MPEITLTPKSTPEEIQNWVGQCIRMARREGRGAKEAAGMCFAMAKEATSKDSGMMEQKKEN